jgi:hypothetical protein
MTYQELHAKLAELLYIEDKGMYDIIIASIIANSQQMGDPVWLTLIGPSSGGKSQIIRPFAKAAPDIIHRVDDMTANTLISGTRGLEGSLLGKIGDFGIISMDDLTVLFSKSPEERGAILSQFRMLYDGRFSKSSGGNKELAPWEGFCGMIAGSTPQIYRVFNDVADMGERFVIYRMRPFDKRKALQHINNNPVPTRELDVKLGEILKEYISGVMGGGLDPEMLELDDWVEEEIAMYAEHCSFLRTSVHLDERSGLVDEFPEPEMPMRVMKQLIPLAKSLQVAQQAKLTKDSIIPLLWVAYSLSNDKRRAYLRTVVGLDLYGKEISSRTVSAVTGLHSEITKKGLDQLQALNIIELSKEDGNHKVWNLVHRGLRDVVMRVDPPAASIEGISDRL